MSDLNRLGLTVSLSLDENNPDDAYLDFILTVDGQYIHNPDTDWVDPVALAASASISGEHFIYTCSCGNPDCVGIDDGILVNHQGRTVRWKLRNPLSWPPEEELPEWTADVEYVFDREEYVRTVTMAIEHAKRMSRYWNAPGELWVGPNLSLPELMALEVSDAFSMAVMPESGSVQ